MDGATRLQEGFFQLPPLAEFERSAPFLVRGHRGLSFAAAWLCRAAAGGRVALARAGAQHGLPETKNVSGSETV